MNKSSVKKNAYLLLIVLILLIGATYAWFTLTIDNSKTNIIRAGKLKINLVDCEKDLVLKNAVPVSDNKGMQSEVCTFKVENTGTTSIDYSVYLDDTDELTTDERMNDKYVKFGLIKNDGDPKIGELPTTGVNPDRVLTSEKISGSTTDTYKLRVWINQDADNGVMGTIFSGKVRVDATQSKPPAANLKAIDKTQTISSVVFQVVNDTPTNTSNTNNKAKVKKLDNKKDAEVVKVASMKSQAAASYDVSVEQDKSVMQYNVLNEDGTTYTAYIEANKKIVAPEDSSNLLAINTATSITGLENLDTSKVVNMSGFFSGIRVPSLDVSSLDTSNVTNMSSMFSRSGVSSVNLNTLNTSNVTDMSYMFSNSNINTLDFSGLDTSNVTDMSYMFNYSQNLTSVNLKNIDISKVNNMTLMFSYTTSLSTLDLSGLDASSVTSMNLMFAGSGINSINLSDFDTSSVKNMQLMFTSTNNLESLDLSDINVSHVTNVDNILNGSKVKQLDLTGLSWDSLTSFNLMFSGANSLEVLNANNMTLKKVTSLGGMTYDGFGSLTNIKQINMNHLNAPELKTLGRIVASYENGAKSVDLVDISYLDAPKLESMEKFLYFSLVKNLNMSHFVDTSNLEDMYYAFSYSPVLENIDLTGTSTANVTNMRYMFQQSGISNFDFSQLDTVNARDFGGFLGGASRIKTVDLSSFDKSHSYTGDGGAFYAPNVENLDLHGLSITNGSEMLSGISNMSSLKSLDMSDMNLEGLSSLSLSGKSKLTTVDFSNTSASSFMSLSGQFSGDSSITTINMENFNVPNVTNLDTAFAGTSSLKDLNANGMKLGKITSMNNTFAGTGYSGKLDLTGLDVSNLTSMSGIFSGSAISEVDMSGWQASKLEQLAGVFAGAMKLTKINMSNSDYSAVTTWNSVFTADSTSSLTEVDMSNTKFSSLTSMEKVFYKFQLLQTVNLSGTDFSKVTSMTHMFSSSPKLTTVNMTGIKTGSLLDISQMFDGDTSLTDVNLKDLDLSTVTNMIGIVNGSGVTSVNLDNVDMSALTTLNRAFYGATSLKTLSMKNAKVGNVTDLRGMFDSDSSLTTVDMSGTVMNTLEHIDQIFKDCSSLTTVDISGASLSADVSCGEAFSNAKSGVSVKVKDATAKSFIEDVFTDSEATGTAVIA